MLWSFTIPQPFIQFFPSPGQPGTLDVPIDVAPERRGEEAELPIVEELSLVSFAPITASMSHRSRSLDKNRTLSQFASYCIDTSSLLSYLYIHDSSDRSYCFLASSPCARPSSRDSAMCCRLCTYTPMRIIIRLELQRLSMPALAQLDISLPLTLTCLLTWK